MIRSSRIFLSSLILVFAAGAAEPGIKTEFIGGTIAGVKAKSTARLDLTGGDEMWFRWSGQTLRIAYSKVDTLEYGQHVSRRFAAAVLLSPVLLLSKSRQHYVTLGYVDYEGKQQALVFKLPKGDIRSVLASLEARTGKRVEFQDEDARKAGQ
jgi:hypothetical protein